MANKILIPLNLLFLVSTSNWLLPRALPMPEQQRHLPSASVENELHAAVAVDLQRTLREFRVTNPEGIQGEVRHSVLQGIW